MTFLDEGSPESPAASDLVGEAAQALAGLAKIDSGQEELSNQATLLEDTLAEVVRGLRDYLDAIEYNPKRLDEVEERLNLIHNLTHKYGGSIQSVIAFGEDARKQLENISNATERITALETDENKLLQVLSKQAGALSAKRKDAAQKMRKGIEIELDNLKMAAARFGVEFKGRADPNGVPLSDGSRVAFEEHGFDRVEFLVAPNPGEGLKPPAKMASGGQASRTALATCRGDRRRPWRRPPKSSRRRFERGERNSCSRYPCAECISTASRPMRSARPAAAAAAAAAGSGRDGRSAPA